MVNNNRVIWVDFVDNRLLAAYYNASDIAIWPGDSTIAIIEAMACKLPVILPVWYGTKYLDESGGVLRFERGDIKKLSNKIGNLAYNNKLRHKMGLHSAVYSRNNLSWGKIAHLTLNLFKNKL